jgi:hypothetical protein
MTVGKIRRHVLTCHRVLAQDLARFTTALADFEVNPSRALEIVQDFLNRIGKNPASTFETNT